MWQQPPKVMILSTRLANTRWALASILSLVAGLIPAAALPVLSTRGATTLAVPGLGASASAQNAQLLRQPIRLDDPEYGKALEETLQSDLSLLSQLLRSDVKLAPELGPVAMPAFPPSTKAGRDDALQFLPRPAFASAAAGAPRAPPTVALSAATAVVSAPSAAGLATSAAASAAARETTAQNRSASSAAPSSDDDQADHDAATGGPAKAAQVQEEPQTEHHIMLAAVGVAVALSLLAWCFARNRLQNMECEETEKAPDDMHEVWLRKPAAEVYRASHSAGGAGSAAQHLPHRQESKNSKG